MKKNIIICLMFASFLSCEKGAEVLPELPSLEEQFFNKISPSIKFEPLSRSVLLQSSINWLKDNKLTDRFPIDQATVSKMTESRTSQITLSALHSRDSDDQLVLHAEDGKIKWAGYMNNEFVGACEGQPNYTLNVKDLKENLLVRMSIDAHAQSVSFSRIQNKTCNWVMAERSLKAQLNKWGWKSVGFNLAKVSNPSIGGVLLVSQNSLICDFEELGLIYAE